MMYGLLKWVLLGPIVRLFVRLRVTGKVPSRGPVIIAANHLAEIDSLVLALASRRRLTFVAKSDYFEDSLRGRLYGRLCRMTGQIPLARDGENGAKGLAAAAAVLAAGDVWAIYPEGTRSPDGRLFRGHTGVMRVALAAGNVTVVPTAISGTRAVNPPHERGWRRGHRRHLVSVHFGEPLDIAGWQKDPENPRAWREATDALMGEIGRLSGQESVNRHPSRQEQAQRDGIMA